MKRTSTKQTVSSQKILVPPWPFASCINATELLRLRSRTLFAVDGKAHQRGSEKDRGTTNNGRDWPRNIIIILQNLWQTGPGWLQSRVFSPRARARPECTVRIQDPLCPPSESPGSRFQTLMQPCFCSSICSLMLRPASGTSSIPHETSGGDFP